MKKNGNLNMKAPKKIYVCSECDYQSSKWLGKCPQCNSWNTMIEETYTPTIKSSMSPSSPTTERDRAIRFSEFEIPEYLRHETGIPEAVRYPYPVLAVDGGKEKAVTLRPRFQHMQKRHGIGTARKSDQHRHVLRYSGKRPRGDKA